MRSLAHTHKDAEHTDYNSYMLNKPSTRRPTHHHVSHHGHITELRQNLAKYKDLTLFA